jgi:Fic family protein
MARYGTVHIETKIIWGYRVLSFQVSLDTQKSLRNLHNEFSRIFSDMSHYSSLEKQAIHGHARISQIGASTRIENALLTDLEVQWMDTVLTVDGKPTSFRKYKSQIENKLSKDRERSIEEVAGCRAMLMLLYGQAKDMFPFLASHLRGLHAELMRYYPPASPYAGRYKIQENRVIERNHGTNEERVVLSPAEPGFQTDIAMKDLIEWYNSTLEMEMSSIAVASELTSRFLIIHPFQDGNGRLGRGLFLMCLLQSPDLSVREVSRYLAIDRHIEKRKEEYYWSLAQASGGGFSQNIQEHDFECFLKFMVNVLRDALEDIPFYRKKQQLILSLSENGTKILSCFEDEPEKRLTTSQIMNKTYLARRTVINNLNQLLEKDLIQRLGEGAGTRYQITF